MFPVKYLTIEKKKAEKILKDFFGDPGNGIFMGKPRKYVLSNPELNLWEPIRKEAIAYFAQNSIPWWKGKGKPSGHLLSSQVACVNHLFPFRNNKKFADAILRSFDHSFSEAVYLDSGYIEFEVTGKKPLGKEKSTQRGANSTSIDAFMVGRRENGEKVLVLIEWKYTESYQPVSCLFAPSRGDKPPTSRLEIYRDLLEKPDCPIITPDPKDLFFEPYYQLMRQTLLGWTMVKNNEYQASDWLHVHVIPKHNHELLNKVTSKNLQGDYLEESWKLQLREPGKYLIISPEIILSYLVRLDESNPVFDYLYQRYWRRYWD